MRSSSLSSSSSSFSSLAERLDAATAGGAGGGSVRGLLEALAQERAAADEEVRTLERDLPEFEASLAPRLRAAAEANETAAASLADVAVQLREHADNSAEVFVNVEALNASTATVTSVSAYLSLLERAREVSEAAREATDPLDATTAFVELAEIHDHVRHVRVPHFQRMLRARAQTLLHKLRDELTRALDAAIVTVRWPKAPRATLMTADEDANGALDEFKEMLLGLVTLQETAQRLTHIKTNGDDTEEKADAGEDENAPLWAVERLTDPIVQRFRFHFSGARKTNDPSKPEWYLGYLLSSVNDHAGFLSHHVQPVCPRADVRLQFMRLLIKPVVRKLRATLPALYDGHQDLFHHTVSEAMAVETQLRTVHGLPEGEPGLLAHIASDDLFEKWVHVEDQHAQRRTRDILDSDEPWRRVLEDIHDRDGDDDGDDVGHAMASGSVGDDTAMQAVVEIVELIEDLTKRFAMLPLLKHRLRFVREIDLGVLECVTKRIRSLQAACVRKGGNALDWQTYAGMMNGARHLAAAVRGWGESVFFLELHFYAQLDDADPSWTSVDLVDLPAFLDVKGTLFDGVLADLTKLEDEMQTTLVRVMMEAFFLNTEEYRRDGHMWNMRVPDGESVDISPTFCAALVQLKEQLSLAERHLAQELFHDVWSTVAAKLNVMVFQTVIAENHFSVAGASQFTHDMETLFLLFKPFSPSAYRNRFKHVKEFIVLLSLALEPEHAGFRTQMASERNTTVLRKVLERHGIRKFSVRQARDMLARIHGDAPKHQRIDDTRDQEEEEEDEKKKKEEEEEEVDFS